MLDDKIADEDTMQEGNENLERFYDMLDVKQAPSY